MSDALLHQALGQIARSHPQAIAVLMRHQLDFCCGGQQRLLDAASERGLDATAIAAEIEAVSLGSAVPSPAQWSDTVLIEHILQRYHAAHREQLPTLLALAEKVERVHADHPLCPNGLYAHLQQMWDELQQHMYKEEEILFPLIARGLGRQAGMPISMMRHEHDDHALAINRMLACCHQLQLPEAACGSWQALYAGVRQLQAELMAHIHLENNVLFHRFDGRMGGLRTGMDIAAV